MTHRDNARPSTSGAQLSVLLVLARAKWYLLAAGLASLAATAIALGLVAYHGGAIAPLLLGLAGALVVVVALVARLRGVLGIIGSTVGGPLVVGATVPALTPGWLAALPVAAADRDRRRRGCCGCLIVLTPVVDWLFSVSGPGETVVAMAILVGAGGMFDVAVTQGSAVLQMAEEGIRTRELLRRAVRVGSDHLTSMIHTLTTVLLAGALPSIASGVGHDVLLQGIGLMFGAIVIALWVPASTVLAWTLVPQAFPAALLREHDDH